VIADILPLELLEWATPIQARYLNAVNEHGGWRAAARALGTDHGTIMSSIRGLKSRAATKGFSPQHDMTRTVPDPYVVRGVSTYYNKDGDPAGQWVKSRLDDQRYQEAQQAAIEAMAAEMPRLALLEGPTDQNVRLLTLYTLTDCHVGMLAWHKEGGEDWDLKIAEATLFGCFEQMIASSPPAKIGFVNQLGDFLHYDSLVPVTPTSGHIVDADGRFPKMVKVAIRILRRVIDIALMKHEHVVVLLAEGNHDMAAATWLQQMFGVMYENEPRVTIIESPLPYYAYQHGRTMLAFHHGHLRKPQEFVRVFAPLFPAMWGNTDFRYAHAGHRHHRQVLEDGGMIVTQHPTLAARDAYSARGGYFANQAATAITYHDTFGQVAENTVSPEMLKDSHD
jgi:hypothetical protein